ncbi:MAG: C1 family peptidase [Candidatus Hydrogenedens sp.]
MKKLYIPIYSMILLFLLSLLVPVSYAQLSQEDIQRLKQEALNNNWTFEVGETSATQRSLNRLTGYIPPDPQYLDELQPHADKPIISTEKLPSRWDWREKIPGGLPPIRDQGSCGSCWAFATVGALECAIKIKDGINVDLSEQWLVDCAQGLFWYGCDGGISAHDWHKGSRTDSCGGYGAVLETDYPYVDYQGSCGCPKPHYYTINDWHYVGPMLGIPSLDALKTAIYRYGPIVASMEAKESFLAYKGGVYNDNLNSKATPNHMVVIVGWDDNYGGGSFIIRNSWGTYWGENGYGYIAYGSSQIGYGADYIEYGTPSDTLLIQPQQDLLFYLSSNNFISPSSIAIRLENISEYNINWTSTTDEGIALNPSSGTLRPGENIIIQLTVTQRPTQSGTYTKTFSITNTVTQNTQNFTLKLKRAYLSPISFLLNSDPGWDKTGNWAFGIPAGIDGDPSSGHTGQYVYGYNLNGSYENDMNEEILTSVPIDCSNIQNVVLSFYRWLGIESSSYDHARIDVSTNGTTWTTIWNHNTGTIQENSWSLKTYDISAIADRQPLLLIRWVMGPTDYIDTYAGWNIDDISISGNSVNVTVPNVVGKILQEAVSTITSSGLTQGQTSELCSNSVPDGSVISQSPQAGTSVPYGTQVNLVVSSGHCPVIVPNVSGLNYTEAENQITSIGLTIGKTEYTCDNTIPENSVISQEPSAGIEVPYGTSINLIISTGPCPPEGSIEGTTEGLEGEWVPEGEGIIEGSPDGSPEGLEGEGSVDGITEGNSEGEGVPEGEGIIEGSPEGSPEGLEGEGSVDGITEGNSEGEGVPEGEGIIEGSPDGSPDGLEGEGISEGSTEGEIIRTYHSADKNNDGIIDLSELLRVIQLFNLGSYHCQTNSEDGYAPGDGIDYDCLPHTSDYKPQDWKFDLSELLRLIQIFNSGGYYYCPGLGEDNYCPKP